MKTIYQTVFTLQLNLTGTLLSSYNTWVIKCIKNVQKMYINVKNVLGNFRGSLFKKMNLTFTKSFSYKKIILYNYLKKNLDGNVKHKAKTLSLYCWLLCTSLCPPKKFICWSPNLQRDGYLEMHLWKVLRIRWSQEGGVLMMGLVPS